MILLHPAHGGCMTSTTAKEIWQNIPRPYCLVQIGVRITHILIRTTTDLDIGGCNLPRNTIALIVRHELQVEAAYTSWSGLCAIFVCARGIVCLLAPRPSDPSLRLTGVSQSQTPETHTRSKNAAIKKRTTRRRRGRTRLMVRVSCCMEARGVPL